MEIEVASRAPGKIALREFIDAVLAFSAEPTPANVGRYMAASQALEDARPPHRTQAPTTPSTPTKRAA